MEPRRCGVHGLVVNADGRCVICRRGDPAQAPSKTSGDWPIVLTVGVVGVLAAGSGAFLVARAISRVEAPPPPPPPGLIVAPQASVPPPRGPEPDPFANDRRPYLEEPAVPPQPVSTGLPEMTQERLEQLKRRVKVTMYMTPRCTLCTQARGFLQSRRIPVTEVDIEASPTDKVVLESKNPAGSVPTFEIDDKLLIGYDVNVLDTAIETAAIARAQK